MKLTDVERAMLEGADGAAKARAMDLLVRYGEALGAERLVETRNVAGVWGASPFMREHVKKGFDAVFSEFNLDSDEIVETPPVAVPTCQLIQGMDFKKWRQQGTPEDVAANQIGAEQYFGARGVQHLATCTPYQVGVVPVRGEHCAWMESSAVIYCNGVLGARTNVEGRESTGAASITGRVPYWGLHIAENRFGTHHIEVEVDVADMMDWGLLGYWIGEAVEEEIPVVTGSVRTPTLVKLKHFGAAAASSGGVEMYHIPGTTPEAPSLEAALGGRAPRVRLTYGRAERKTAYDNLNITGRSRDVDFVMLGCPHNSIEQMWEVARLIEGRKVSANTVLWVHTPSAIRDVATRSGFVKVIEDAGGHVMSDTCPAISRMMPNGTKVVVTDSAKQAHYLPPLTGVQSWFGSLADCVEAAVTGRWNGGLA